MGLLNNVIKVFVGDKAKKDLGEIQPMVDLIKSKEAEISQLSLDGLRAKSDEFRARLKEAQAETNKQLEALSTEAESAQDIQRKEDIYAEIDQLKDALYEIEKTVLDEILPEAFAVIKE